MQLTDEQLAALESYERFAARIAEAVKAIAEKHGFAVDGEADRVAHLSRYITVYSVDDDGINDEQIAQVRISTHGQRYAGPDWSFEQSDSDESVARGLAAVEAKCVRWLSL